MERILQLDKLDKKKLLTEYLLLGLYNLAYSYAVDPVVTTPVFISIIFNYYKMSKTPNEINKIYCNNHES